MNDLPPALAAKIEGINRDIDACVAERADLSALIFELEHRREDYLEAAEICRQAWCPPFSEEQIDSMRATALATDVANAKELVAAQPRRRRDLREVVRQIFRNEPLTAVGATTDWIAAEASKDGRTVRASEIEKTLARMNGEVEQIGNGWRLAVGPAHPAAVPADGEEAPASPMPSAAVEPPREPPLSRVTSVVYSQLGTAREPR